MEWTVESAFGALGDSAYVAVRDDGTPIHIGA